MIRPTILRSGRQAVTLQVTNKSSVGIVIHKIDSTTGGDLWRKVCLYDANKEAHWGQPELMEAIYVDT